MTETAPGAASGKHCETCKCAHQEDEERWNQAIDWLLNTACGTVHDRDLNAAKNILALGRRERLNACGGQVRPPLSVAQAGEAGNHRSAA